MTDVLAGKRILVVEDEYFIASDLTRALRAERAIVIGPTGRAGQALSLLGEGEVDAAILDVNLEGDTVFPIADRLAVARVPFLFVTGYDGWALPAAYRDAPRLRKPFRMRALMDEVARLLDRETVS